jgi:hypothetical protein
VCRWVERLVCMEARFEGLKVWRMRVCGCRGKDHEANECVLLDRWAV